jgi:hypothetical protein
MKQTRRFSSAGYVTSEDSNSGMKEAYDDRIAAEEAKRKKDVENEGGKVSEGERVSMTPPSKPTSPASPAAPATPAAPAKPRVVSKAELEKSGMSLRDFLNKERGLTRRKDSSAPAKAESIAGPRDDGAYRGMRSDMKDVGGGRSGGRGGPEAGEGSESKPAGAYRGMRSDPEPVGAYRSIRSDPKPEGAYRGMRSDMKKGGAVKKKPVAKYASGGSVSSASKRADGIATKGKTRGKMC